MSIIITSLEMPTERESFNLTIKYNGTVFDTETEIQVAEAYELPPHGRLIDAGALVNKLVHSEFFSMSDYNNFVGLVLKASTIIPAEEG